LTVRDIIRRKGSAAADRGTRIVVTLGFFVAYAGAILACSVLRPPVWTMGSWHLVTGEIVAWAGLAIRVWAIIVLGASFRLTVEVDSDQAVVERGPYRWVRHPSYTGLLFIAIGFGFALGNWVSLAVLVVIPPIGIVRRIQVEETQLIAMMGQPYVDYRTRTKRLIPGIW
jgi:protein-S-isoprenylcysteine O-methyltransferase Ste14